MNKQDQLWCRHSEATVAPVFSPRTGRAKLCSASIMLDSSHGSTAASAQPAVVNAHGYHQMSAADILHLAKGPDSYNRSLQRRAEMTGMQKAQIAAIGESRSLWYALRRHGTKAQCAEWLNILHSNSTWLDDKESDDEILRRQYLHLWEAVRSFEPD